jgi:hypothetical protein
VIAFAGEQRFGFEVGDVSFRVVQLAVEFFQEIVALLGVGFFLGEVDVGIEIAGERGQLVVGGDLIFGAFAIAQDGLCRFLIVPEVGLGDARFQRFQAFAMGSGVKDSSEPWKCAVSGVRSGVGGLRGSFGFVLAMEDTNFSSGAEAQVAPIPNVEPKGPTPKVKIGDALRCCWWPWMGGFPLLGSGFLRWRCFLSWKLWPTE